MRSPAGSGAHLFDWSAMAAILRWFRFSPGYNSGAGAFSLGTIEED